MSWTWHGLTTQQRFENKFIPEPNTGCFVWTERLKRDGYGQFKYLGMMQQAHRVAWMLYRGDIPEGWSVLHHCDNPWCVNYFAHLYLGTQLENMQDRSRRGRHNYEPGIAAAAQLKRAKTHCKQGHLLDRSTGWARCRVCIAAATRRYREKHG